MGERLVLDLETQREFSEVEGRKPELLGVSLTGVYSYEEDRSGQKTGIWSFSPLNRLVANSRPCSLP